MLTRNSRLPFRRETTYFALHFSFQDTLFEHEIVKCGAHQHLCLICLPYCDQPLRTSLSCSSAFRQRYAEHSGSAEKAKTCAGNRTRRVPCEWKWCSDTFAKFDPVKSDRSMPVSMNQNMHGKRSYNGLHKTRAHIKILSHMQAACPASKIGKSYERQKW